VVLRQFSPDFKGIETPSRFFCRINFGGNSALISKGLRPTNQPYFEIKMGGNSALISKGLRQEAHHVLATDLGGNSALISKGLRRPPESGFRARSARQFSPDFKGIETRRGADTIQS